MARKADLAGSRKRVAPSASASSIRAKHRPATTQTSRSTISGGSFPIEFIRAMRRVKAEVYSGSLSDELELTKDYLWIHALKDLATRFDIDSEFFRLLHRFDREQPLPNGHKSVASFVSELNKHIHALEVQAEMGRLVDQILEVNVISLDDDWRQKASTYVQHIKAEVRKASIEEGLRERITARILDLEREIERNRTTTSAISEVWLGLCEAVGRGAKSLEPAVRVVERLAGAVTSARSVSAAYAKQLRLPSPETLGLSELPANQDKTD